MGQTGYESTEGPAALVLNNNVSSLWHTDCYGTITEYEILVSADETPALGCDYINGERFCCDVVKEFRFVDVSTGQFYFDPLSGLWRTRLPPALIHRSTSDEPVDYGRLVQKHIILLKILGDTIAPLEQERSVIWIT